MKVIFDHQIFGLQNYGGISRYFVGLMEGLKEKKVDYDLINKYSNNTYLLNTDIGKNTIRYKELTWFKSSKNLFLFKIGGYIRFSQKYFINILNKFNTIRLLKKEKNYIFHPTYYDPYFLKYIGKNPFVLTVHDMIHEIVNNQTSSGYPIAKWKKELVNRANKIIVISENTKKDLIKILKVDASKINIVSLYQSLKYKKNVSHELNLPDKYVLFVGDRAGYKNFDKLLEAFGLLAEKYFDLSLVCAGGQLFSGFENAKIKQMGLRGRVTHVMFNSDEQLVELYSRALIFVFPSVYEGFGIPLLEAFECRVPVACSDASSFPEVVGDAALLFDPNKSVSIAKQIERIYSDNKLRKKMIDLGVNRRSLFTIEKTVIATLDVYKSLMK